jgi:hypothetical protein
MDYEGNTLILYNIKYTMSRNNVNSSSNPFSNFSQYSFWQSALWEEILSHTGQAEVIHYIS